MSFGNTSALGFGSMSLHPKHKIIVGVDYGTTFTGASYVSTDNSSIRDIIIIKTWPGPTRDSHTVFKAPSRIAYPTDNRRLGNQRWGFEVEPSMVAYSWTKLLLDENTPLTKYDDTALENASGMGILRLPANKTAVDVVSDYLSEVYKHIHRTIAKQITEETLRITPLEFWFTVPAIWSDQAQDATRKAAQRAGFGRSVERPKDEIFMITEPEAAAVAALKKTTTDGLGASVKPGDGILICDCGGGTVDITTYLVNRVDPSLAFEELCTGIGGKCGSTAVDRNFYKLMSDRFGDDFDSLPPKRKSPGSDFMMKFESIKRDFGYSTEEKTHELPLNMTVEGPNPEHFDDDERRVIISDDDLRAIFDPVVDQIINLVRQQMKDALADAGHSLINRIILVGGFGDSEYLSQAFRKSFEEGGKVAVTVPDNTQAVIVQGAALRGLDGLRSTTKRCRRHYGFAWSLDFRYGIDDEEEAYINEFDNQKKAPGIMNWMIAKGEKYTEDHSYAASVGRVHYSGDDLKKSNHLYSCDEIHAPERQKHKDVRPVGKIEVDFTHVDLAMFDKKYISGKTAYNLEYSIKVIFGAQDGILKFEASSQGKVIGYTSIKFATAKYY